MYYYKLTGPSHSVQRVIRYFSLRVEREHSATDVDVEVDAAEAEDVETFAESLGVTWKEI